MSEAVASPQPTANAKVTRADVALRHTPVVALLVAVGYYLTAKIGFAFALQPGSVSTLWLPNSILLAALLLTDRRFWWIIIAAAFPAHLLSELHSGVPVSMVLSWFLSNSVQALLGAICIRKVIGRPLQLESFRHFTVFVIFGVFLAPFLSSFLDIALVKLNGWGAAPFWELWRVRFLANVVATLTVVPVIITWADRGIEARQRASIWRYVEAALLAVSLLGISVVVFFVTEGSPSVLYGPLPFLLWAAVRFGPRGTSTSLLVVMFLAIWGAVGGHGPFVAKSAANNAISIQWFLIVVSIPMMSIATIIQERERAREAARQNQEQLAMALDAAQMGTWDWYINEDIAKWSDQTKRIFGRSTTDPEVSAEKFFEMLHPDDRLSVQRAISRAISEGSPYEAEFRIRQQDGSVRWVRGKGKVLYDTAGKPIRMVGLNADITERKHAEQAHQAILRALPDMMFLHTKEGVYLDYHTRDPQSLLVFPEAFLGKNLKDILPPELAARVMECVGRLESMDEIQVLEYSLPIGDEERHFEARLVAAEDNNVLSIVRDVTETRRAAEGLRRGEEKLLDSNREIRELAARLITAQEQERRRISLLLHDDVSQNIAALGVIISRLKRKLPDSSGQMRDELDRLAQQINDLTTQIRQLSHQLHPEVLEHVGLLTALESQVAEFGQEEQIEAKFSAEVGRQPIPLDVSLGVYRVAIEAMRNVSRHSGAKAANISLREADGFLTLEVSDSGRGFDVEKAKRGSGIGLVSAEERVKFLQGTFEIKSSPGNGTTLVARIPLMRGK